MTDTPLDPLALSMQLAEKEAMNKKLYAECCKLIRENVELMAEVRRLKAVIDRLL